MIDYTAPAVHFIFGERKYVWFDIRASGETGFTIQNAKWKLKKGGKEVTSGSCEVDSGTTVRVLLDPPERGDFILEMSYEVPPELKKSEVVVLVT